MMLSHEQIWNAIDSLAERYGLSASGLAKRAGLDPTTFNPSKRVGTDGRLRWPSTESLAKVLDATGADLDEFMALMGRKPSGKVRRKVLIEDHFPSGQGLSTLAGALADRRNAVVRVEGWEGAPLYGPGTLLVISPEAPRKGDRAAIMTRLGLRIGIWRKKGTKAIEMASVSDSPPLIQIPLADVLWLGRIRFASQ
jgi:hypothetical protein